MKARTSTQNAPFRLGLVQGVPIALGYFSVSIGFGLLATTGGLSIGQAVLISMANLTSAGQLAGVQVMLAGGGLLEMAISQLFINLRYALMSVALSQKLEDSIRLPQRLGLAFFITDEIFAVSSSQSGQLSSRHMLGLALLPYCGWALGTLVGAIAGTALPALIRDGLGIAIYGMFLAILMPPLRKDRAIRTSILIAVALRCVLMILPGLSSIPSGFSVVLCALAASVFCAVRYPVKEVA